MWMPAAWMPAVLSAVLVGYVAADFHDCSPDEQGRSPCQEICYATETCARCHVYGSGPLNPSRCRDLRSERQVNCDHLDIHLLQPHDEKAEGAIHCGFSWHGRRYSYCVVDSNQIYILDESHSEHGHH